MNQEQLDRIEKKLDTILKILKPEKVGGTTDEDWDKLGESFG